MPTVISHSLVGVVFGKIFSRRAGIKFWILSIVCAVLPDLDAFLRYFGVPDEHMFAHRGFFHSMIFTLMIAFFIVLAGFREIKHFSKERWSIVACFFLIGLSHGILDAMTTGGSGVGFFMPFDSARYFLPVRPIRVSPFSLMRFFESEGKRILVSELFWIWIPSVITLIILKLAYDRRYSKKIS